MKGNRNKNIAKALAWILVFALIYLIGYGVHRDKVMSKKAKETVRLQKIVKEDIKEDAKDDVEETYNKILRYKDKNWLAIGDEITSANQYQNYVQQICEFAKVTTKARTGMYLHMMDDNITKEVLEDVDVVTVLASANDFGSNRLLGSINDSTFLDTFYSDMKAVIENIERNKPEVEIIFITTPYIGTERYGFTTNYVENTLEDYTKAMKEVCALYDIPILDLYTVSGINQDNLLNYSDNSMQPNEAGMELIGNIIGGFMNGL